MLDEVKIRVTSVKVRVSLTQLKASVAEVLTQVPSVSVIIAKHCVTRIHTRQDNTLQISHRLQVSQSVSRLTLTLTLTLDLTSHE